MSEITYSDFEKIEIRAGKIVAVDDFPKARKSAYKLTIDFGEFGVRRSSAQITTLYSKESLIGRQIVAITNFPSRQIADFGSEVLVLGVVGEDGEVVLLTTEREVDLGLRIS
jgi:tRNA-binding protein